MLVGAGGNAGNQTTLAVIRELGRSPRALVSLHQGGSSRWAIIMKIVSAEFQDGIKMAIPLTILGGLRAYIALSGTASSDKSSALASSIAVSLFMILLSSVILGAVIPLGLASLRIDPTHAGPAIQVVMDVVGVLTTCLVSSMTLSTTRT
jgi:Mg/Co/Ni transporter MgtE